MRPEQQTRLSRQGGATAMLEEIIEEVKDGMEKSIEALRRDLAAIR